MRIRYAVVTALQSETEVIINKPTFAPKPWPLPGFGSLGDNGGLGGTDLLLD